MSPHRPHKNLEELQTSSALPKVDAHMSSNLELLEYSSYRNSPQFRSAVVAKNQKGSTLKRKTLRANTWTRITDSFIDWWMGELLAVLLSITAFFAIVILLRKYDDHELPRLPHHVSLNFVVSTLATVAKISLLLVVASALGQFKWLWMSSKHRRLQDLQVFDEASRGPLGASKLLASREGL